MGQLVTNRTLYDQLNSTLARTSSIMGRLENPRGLFGVDATMARCTSFPTVTVSALSEASFETSSQPRNEATQVSDSGL